MIQQNPTTDPQASQRLGSVLGGALAEAEHAARQAAALSMPGIRAMLDGHVALPVTDQVPVRPVVFCVATLAAADSAGVIALRLSDRNPVGRESVDRMRGTLRALVGATHDGVHALHGVTDDASRARLAHSTARAAHTSADALQLLAGEARGQHATAIPLYPVPRSWRALNERLHWTILDKDRRWSDEQHDVAATARDAAMRAFSVCAEVHNHGGLTAAMHRVTRLTALASAYAGWAALTARASEPSLM